MRFPTVVLVAALIAAQAPGALAAEAVGSVERVQSEAFATNAEGERRLAPGAAIFADDRLATGAESRLEVVFSDGTSLILGADGAIAIAEYAFDGTGGTSSFAVLSGAFAFASGVIGENDPDDVLVTTPVATIGIRGTQFWGGRLEGTFGVLVLEGAVEVMTRGGSVLLDEVGEGTDIASSEAAPGAPRQWGDAKKERALATIAFTEE